MRRTELKRGTKELKRTELRRGDSQLKRTRIKPRKSKAKADYDAELDRLTPALYARANGLCELRIPGVCKGGRVQMARHHRQMKSQGGPNTMANVRVICELGCHRWVHRHVERSYLMGWLVKSHDDPELIEFQRPATVRS